MRRFVTICAVAGMLLVASTASGNTVASSTMYFRGTLVDDGAGGLTGVLAMLDEDAEGIGDGKGYDIYGEEGATAWFGDDPGGGPVWTSQLIGADHDGWPTWTPDTPDWYQYSLELAIVGGQQKWAVRNHPGATQANPWYDTAFWGAEKPPCGVPMSGLMNWTTTPKFATETDTGAYLPATGTAEIPNGAAGYGGGPQAWDMDWSWGSEVVPLELPGFTVALTNIGGDDYDVVLTPADGPVVNTTTGVSYGTIQAAVDAASVGDSISVAAGTYPEYVHITTDGLTIQGAGIDQSIIDLDGLIPYWHYAGCSSSFASRAGVLITGYGSPDEIVENCTFKGFTVKNAGLNPPITASGTHTGASHATVLTDSGASFPTPDGLVGQWVHNYGDRDLADYSPARSYGQITGNTATTVTVASLSGGVDNDWDDGDEYLITPYQEFYNSWWIHYPNYDGIRGISIGNGKNILIQDCKVTDSGYGGIGTGYARCVSTHKYSEDITIDGCIVTDHPRSGINIGNNVGAFAVVNCTCERNKSPHYADATREYAGYGIQVSGTKNYGMASGLIANNTCNDNGFIGINVTKYTDGVIVQNNTVTAHNLDEDGAGIFFYHWGSPEYCKNHVIADNTVTGNIRGVVAYYASDSTIERNTITTDSGSFDTGQAAIKIDNAHNVEVKDNTISCEGVGVNVTSSGSYGNTFSGNFIDGAMFAGIYIRSGAYDNTFLCNAITNTVSDTFTQYADWGTHTGGNGEATLVDSTMSWTEDALIGMTVINLTDESSGTITDNDATTVTATLSGGTDNLWDTDDDYDIIYDDTQADGVFLRGGSCYAAGHAGTGNVFHENSIHGNAGDGIENQISTDVDATDNWWGNASGPAHASNPAGTGDSVSDGVIYNPWAGAEPACVPTAPTGDNVLWLNATGDSLYVKVGDPVVIDMDVLNLLQMVNGCQALLGFDSTYLTAGAGCVVAGGGVWDEVIYEQFPAAGELDTAIGVQAWGHIGTDADGTVAVISFTAGSEGTTQLVFRSDVDSEYATMLSDMNANPVWPTKINSQTIVIDSSLPTISIDSATQDSTELLGGCPPNAVQGVVSIEVTASDSGDAGLAGPPTVTVTDADSDSMVVTGPVSVVGDVYTYEVTVLSTTANGTAQITADVCDNAGNCAVQATGSFCINKNQITGNVELESLVDTSRDVTFVATGGMSSKTWTLTLSFTGSVASFTLTDVPDTSTHVSAKTAWNLRSKVTLGGGGDNQWTADLTGTEMLLGGDLNGTNFVNILDYSILAVTYGSTTDLRGDINGSGDVNLTDYTILAANYFETGDDE